MRGCDDCSGMCDPRHLGSLAVSKTDGSWFGSACQALLCCLESSAKKLHGVAVRPDFRRDLGRNTLLDLDSEYCDQDGEPGAEPHKRCRCLVAEHGYLFPRMFFGGLEPDLVRHCGILCQDMVERLQPHGDS